MICSECNYLHGPYSVEDVQTEGFILGRIKITGFIKSNFSNNYHWRIKVISKYKTRKKYNHPNGAQIWVKNVDSHKRH